MEEILKGALSGTGAAGALLIFYLWKLAPALDALRDEVRAGFRSLEEASYIRSKADLLKLIASQGIAPVVKEEAAEMVRKIEELEK